MPPNPQPRSTKPILAVPLAAGVYAACFGLFFGADRWQPLANGLGLAMLVTSSVAVGLTIGRWKAVLIVLLLVPVGVLTGPGFVLALPILLLGSAALVALGVGLRALASRRGATATARMRSMGFAGLAAAATLASWGVYLAHRVVDHTPAHPSLISDRDGRYRGLAVGDPAGTARRLFGTPVLGDPDWAPSPLGEEDLSGPSSMLDWQTWRYRKLVVFVDHGRVQGYATTDPAAETIAGVGVGDSLAIAKRAYPGLSCFGVILGSDSEQPSYPACQGRLGNGLAIWFGGDPIDSIWVTENYDHITSPIIQPR